jgi:hypothetical protein
MCDINEVNRTDKNIHTSSCWMNEWKSFVWATIINRIFFQTSTWLDLMNEWMKNRQHESNSFNAGLWEWLWRNYESLFSCGFSACLWRCLGRILFTFRLECWWDLKVLCDSSNIVYNSTKISNNPASLLQLKP